MSSYQYRKFSCGYRTIVQPYYFHNGISCAGKITSLYWTRTPIMFIRLLFYFPKHVHHQYNTIQYNNKANLRDLKAATGLVILLKLDSNHRFLAGVTLKFDGWPRKIIRHVFYTTSSFVYHFISISEFKLELQSGNAQFGSNSTIFRAVWPWNLTDDLEK